VTSEEDLGKEWMCVGQAKVNTFHQFRGSKQRLRRTGNYLSLMIPRGLVKDGLNDSLLHNYDLPGKGFINYILPCGCLAHIRYVLYCETDW